MLNHDADANGMRDAARIATQHPEHPLSQAVLHLVDEVARVQAVLVTQGHRLAELTRERQEETR